MANIYEELPPRNSGLNNDEYLTFTPNTFYADTILPTVAQDSNEEKNQLDESSETYEELKLEDKPISGPIEQLQINEPTSPGKKCCQKATPWWAWVFLAIAIIMMFMMAGGAVWYVKRKSTASMSTLRTVSTKMPRTTKGFHWYMTHTPIKTTKASRARTTTRTTIAPMTTLKTLMTVLTTRPQTTQGIYWYMTHTPIKTTKASRARTTTTMAPMTMLTTLMTVPTTRPQTTQAAGYLTEWGQWALCMCVSGPHTGTRVRTRRCISPPGQNNPCNGATTETRNCHDQNCVYRDCKDAKSQNQLPTNIDISPDGGPIFNVACYQEFDGGGWTVIQRRDAPTVGFTHTWAEYRRGFGSVTSSHWVGNENIHRLTHNRRQSLFVMMDTIPGRIFALYSHFAVAGEVNLYRLNISHFSRGNATDGMQYAHNFKFTTVDSDNDIVTEYNCAQFLGGGWWFGYRDGCGPTNLNANEMWWWNFVIAKNLYPTRSIMMVRGR